MNNEIDKLKLRLHLYSKWNGDCLECTYKARSVSGYALVKFRRSTAGAHRISWMIHKGEIPSGLFVLHRCDNPLCIRIDHLFLGTAKDNAVDMQVKGRDNYQGATKHSQDKVQRAIDLKRSGNSYKEIAKILEISQSTVQSFFRRTSLQEEVKDFYKVPKYSQEVRNKAWELRKEGMKNKKIQELLKIPKKTLLNIFEKFRKIQNS